jgi:hypothetical protein
VLELNQTRKYHIVQLLATPAVLVCLEDLQVLQVLQVQLLLLARLDLAPQVHPELLELPGDLEDLGFPMYQMNW